MSTNIRPAVTTAITATLVGAVGGGVVFTAMARDLHRYLTFVAFLGLVAVAVVLAWAYQTYVKPKPPAVEETEVDPAS